MGHSGNFNPINQKVVISRLINSVYYSIGTCFIVKLTMANEVYRLLAIHRKKVLADKNYKTLRGARIAFFKRFQDLAWRKDVAAVWSDFYQPDRDWIDKMLSIAENA